MNAKEKPSLWMRVGRLNSRPGIHILELGADDNELTTAELRQLVDMLNRYVDSLGRDE